MKQKRTIKCPHCDKEILAVAKKCKYCHNWIKLSTKGVPDGKATTNSIYKDITWADIKEDNKPSTSANKAKSNSTAVNKNTSPRAGYICWFLCIVIEVVILGLLG